MHKNILWVILITLKVTVSVQQCHLGQNKFSVNQWNIQFQLRIAYKWLMLLPGSSNHDVDLYRHVKVNTKKMKWGEIGLFSSFL